MRGTWRQTLGKPVFPTPRDEKKGGTPNHKILTTGFGGSKPGWVNIQLMIQRIPDVAGKMCTALWDTGAKISLVTFSMQKSGIQKSSFLHSDLVSWIKEQKKSKKHYRVLLKKIDSSVAEIMLYGVDKITGDAVRMDLSIAKSTFPAVFHDLESPGSPIHLLIGMVHMEDTPKEQERGKNLVLSRSAFITEYIVCGNMGVV